jgi:ubiquinone/menaquinone biosynthesis C-methylase UbiE
MKYKTFNEFWGEFLQVTFHIDNPERWLARERRAKWVLGHLNISYNSKILNVGCGDGLLDICLSRMGLEMTSIDRNTKVLELARQSDDTQKVIFLDCDFRQLNLKAESFDAALFLEAVGLVSCEQDQKLFQNIFSCLKPGAKFIVDCPLKVETENSWTKKFTSGDVSAKSSYNENTKIQQIDFYFTDSSGETFGLLDPTDPIRNSGSGIARYLYSKEELKQMLNSVGFEVLEVDHYYGENYYGFLAKKPS